MFKEILAKLMGKQSLSQAEAYQAMKQILNGEVTSAQIGSFITLLTYRGVEVEELIGLTKAMRDHATPLELGFDEELVDTCGTGGGKVKTFNVSTASAITASSSGLKVAKHGNRAATSLTGSADVLQELGFSIDLTPEQVAEKLRRKNMCFMFAPLYHQAMKHAAPARKELGFRTVFNVLGPLTNPAGAKKQVIGVFDQSYSLKMAKTLKELGSKHVLIVHSEDGLDEFSIASPTYVTELREGDIEQYTLSPEEVGIQRFPLQEIQVRTAAESAQLIVDVFNGNHKEAAYQMIAYNAGAALYVGGKAATIAEGIQAAKELLDSGQAARHYQNLKETEGETSHAS